MKFYYFDLEETIFTGEGASHQDGKIIQRVQTSIMVVLGAVLVAVDGSLIPNEMRSWPRFFRCIAVTSQPSLSLSSRYSCKHCGANVYLLSVNHDLRRLLVSTNVPQ